MTVGSVANFLSLKPPGSLEKRTRTAADAFNTFFAPMLQQQPFQAQMANTSTRSDDKVAIDADRRRAKAAINDERKTYGETAARQGGVEESQSVKSKQSFPGEAGEKTKGESNGDRKEFQTADSFRTGAISRAGREKGVPQQAGGNIPSNGRALIAAWRQLGLAAEISADEALMFSELLPAFPKGGKTGDERIFPHLFSGKIGDEPGNLNPEMEFLLETTKDGANPELKSKTETIGVALKNTGDGGQSAKIVMGIEGTEMPEVEAQGISVPFREESGNLAGRLAEAAPEGKQATLEGKPSGMESKTAVGTAVGEGLGQKGMGADAGNGSSVGSQVHFNTVFNGIERPTGGPFISNLPMVVNSVLESARLARLGNQQELQLQLRPESLGNLKIKALMTGNDLSLHLLVENNAAARVLQSMVAELRQTAFQQGLRLDQVQVEVQTDAGGFNGQTHKGDQEKHHRQTDGWRHQRAGWQGEAAAVAKAYGSQYLFDYLA